MFAPAAAGTLSPIAEMTGKHAKNISRYIRKIERLSVQKECLNQLTLSRILCHCSVSPRIPALDSWTTYTGKVGELIVNLFLPSSKCSLCNFTKTAAWEVGVLAIEMGNCKYTQ